MKKLLLSLAAICCTLATNATDLWTGESAVTWKTTLYLDGSKFTDAQVGDKLTLNFTVPGESGDVIELKSDGKRLTGTCFHSFGTADTSYEVYVTEDMLAKLQTHGLDVCGNLFTATKVSIDNVGFNMPEGAIWGGYFWCDNWKTMELWKEAFDNYSNRRYLIINISEESFDYNYDLNIISTWEKGAFTNADNTEYGKHQIILDTQKLSGGLMDAISGNDRVMFQGNCKLEDHGFNITSIVLADDISVSIDEDGYATLFHSKKNLLVPEGVSAWTYGQDGDKITATESYKSGDVIPAGTAVVLYSEIPYTYTFQLKANGGEQATGSLLHGTDKTQQVTADGTPYILGLGSKGIAFYAAAPSYGHTFTNGAHKAYLELSSTAQVRQFISLKGETGQTTGISAAEAGGNRTQHIFDLSGRRANNTHKGLYIVNGKKTIM